MQKLNNKVMIITGGAQGMGEMHAKKQLNMVLKSLSLISMRKKEMN